MQATPILNNEFATLHYHADSKIIHHTFHKPIGGDEFRRVLLSGYESLKANGAIKWLSDDRNNAALSDDDGAWATTVWFPMVQSAGWKHWAIVVPQDIMGRMNMNEFIQLYYDKGVNVMVFSNPDDALKWLKAQ